jgi:zinc protease
LRAEIAARAGRRRDGRRAEPGQGAARGGQIYKLDSMFAQAMEIGQLEAVGLPYRSGERIIEKLKAVTAEQVQEVAKRYFGDDGLTVGVLDPQPLAGAPRRPAANVRH